jgi:hypothetical protein
MHYSQAILNRPMIFIVRTMLFELFIIPTRAWLPMALEITGIQRVGWIGKTNARCEYP